MCKGSNVPVDDSGNFLNWWFEKPRLTAKALDILRSYYSNYERNFNGYLKQVWSDRHLELDMELEVLTDKHDTKILDLGCGTGSVSLYIGYKLQGHGEVLGIDINEDRLFCARERKKVLEREVGFEINCEFRRSNVLCLNKKNKFDLIYLEEVLHHMEPRIEVVKKISDSLKDNGVLVVSEVNAYNPFMQIYLFKKRGFRTIVKRVGEDGEGYLYGVERVIPAREVAKLFGNNNLKVKSLRYFRVAGSKLARVMDKRGLSLMKLEKRLCKIGLLSRIISVHYNIVFQK